MCCQRSSLPPPRDQKSIVDPARLLKPYLNVRINHYFSNTVYNKISLRAFLYKLEAGTIGRLWFTFHASPLFPVFHFFFILAHLHFTFPNFRSLENVPER